MNAKSLHARIEKLDFELAIGDGLRLPDQLVQPLLGHRAVALLVDVDAVSRARRLSIDQHAKSHGRSRRCRTHDEMKIAGVKAVRDASVGLVQQRRRRCFTVQSPDSAQSFRRNRAGSS